MVGVAVHDSAQARSVEEAVLVLALAQMQHHPRAALRRLHGLHREIALAAGFPTHALVPRKARPARGDGDAIGDHEARVEADAELTDELRVSRLVPGQRFQELAGAGLGDRAEILDDLLAAHADAVVSDGDSTGLLVEVHVDAELSVALVEGFVGKRFEAQLVAGVRCVRDELPEEDLLVAVEGVDHQIEQLACLGLEAAGLFRGLDSHGLMLLLTGELGPPATGSDRIMRAKFPFSR